MNPTVNWVPTKIRWFAAILVTGGSLVGGGCAPDHVRIVRIPAPEAAVVHRTARIGDVQFAETDHALYRSRDAGRKWDMVEVPEGSDVFFCGPALYASFYQQRAIFRSDNVGASWEPLQSGGALES